MKYEYCYQFFAGYMPVFFCFEKIFKFVGTFLLFYLVLYMKGESVSKNNLQKPNQENRERRGNIESRKERIRVFGNRFRNSKVQRQAISDYHFMKNNDIETLEDLFNDIQRTKTEISELEQQRYQYDNKRRRAKTPGDINIYKKKRKELTKQITPLRKRLKQAEKIWDKSPHLLELVKQEQSLEMQARQKIKNKEWSR